MVTVLDNSTTKHCNYTKRRENNYRVSAITEGCNNKAHLKLKEITDTSRRSLPVVPYEKKFLKTFHKIHRKSPVLESLFKKSWNLRPATLLKQRRKHGCFSTNFAKFLRTPFLQNTSTGCLSTFGFFKLKLTCSAFFSTLICFAGGLKICIAKRNLFTQTEKLEQILAVLPKKRNQMKQESQQRTQIARQTKGT